MNVAWKFAFGCCMAVVASLNFSIKMLNCLFKLDIDAGIILVDGKEFTFPKLPEEIIAIRDAGGLLAYTRNKLKKGN